MDLPAQCHHDYDFSIVFLKFDANLETNLLVMIAEKQKEKDDRRLSCPQTVVELLEDHKQWRRIR
jgi:hypothetical protein